MKEGKILMIMTMTEFRSWFSVTARQQKIKFFFFQKVVFLLVVVVDYLITGQFVLKLEEGIQNYIKVVRVNIA